MSCHFSCRLQRDKVLDKVPSAVSSDQIGVTLLLGLSGSVAAVCLRSWVSIEVRGDLRHSKSDSVSGTCAQATDAANSGGIVEMYQSFFKGCHPRACKRLGAYESSHRDGGTCSSCASSGKVGYGDGCKIGFDNVGVRRASDIRSGCIGGRNMAGNGV